MYKRFEQTMVTHCAATLAGQKIGSLYSYCPEAGEDVQAHLETITPLLAAKGIALRLLQNTLQRCLVFVYRPASLYALLQQAAIRKFFQQQGYAGVEPDGLLCEIAARLAAGGAFPHEIGLFLGYPLADVQGYIQHCGQHAHCTGLWKVYGDAQEAQRRFQVYRHCRKAVLANYQRGMTLSRLAVSA